MACPLYVEGKTIALVAVRKSHKLASTIDAGSLFALGAIDECLEALQGSTTHESVMLGVRCFLRLGRLNEAESTINSYWAVVRDHGSDRERGESAMLRAVIANKLGKAIVALSAFGDARGYLYSSTASDSLLLELDAYQGLMALSSGDIETATALALGALECAALRPRILAREILAQVCAVKDDFEGQLAYCEANLTELLASPLDKFLLTSTLKNVAILAQQQDRVDRYKDLKAEADKMDFVGLNKIFESDLYRELGLLSARHGDHLTAFRYLRRSAATAPATISELWAVLDGAAVAREIGESFASADRLAHAEELAATVDWASTAMDQRLILFVLAEEQAHANPRAARNTLDAVTKMTRGVAGSAGPMVDRRFQALLMRATGIVLKYEGSRGLAGSYLRQSFEYWLSIGFTWEAAVTALEALEVNGDSAYADYLKKYMARMPSQYLERRLDQITSCKEVLAS